MVDLLPYEDALERILSQCPPPRTVAVPLERCLDRVLARPVHADADVPPFNKSFMDGFAVHSADVTEVPACLNVVGEVAAGADSLPAVAPGETVRIMTGAPVPPQTDAVQMVEESRMLDGSTVEILKPAAPGTNISRQGSEVSKGSVVLEPGRVIGPAEIGVLASFGQARPEVFRPLTAGVVSTGDELVPVESQPRFGQIRNSNGPMISALCRRLGLNVESEVSVGDDPERTAEVIRDGLKFDLLLLSGGVSMGEYDFVHRILEREGARLIFHKAAVKPGKPICVGRKGSTLAFGLPGNPVSAFVTFQLFVRPMVRRWMGFQSVTLRRIEATLTRAVSHKPGRTFFKPARTDWSGEIRVSPVDTGGSADLTGFSRADSLLVIPAQVSGIAAGARVSVLLLDADPGRCRLG